MSKCKSLSGRIDVDDCHQHTSLAKAFREAGANLAVTDDTSEFAGHDLAAFPKQSVGGERDGLAHKMILRRLERTSRYGGDRAGNPFALR